MRTLILAALIAGTAPAYAWDSPQSQSQSHSQSQSSARSSSHSSSQSSSHATGGTANANGGAASATGNATGNGAVSVDSERSTAAPALGALSSGVCSGASGGVSLGFLPFGGGANYGSIDPQCTLRNNILLVMQFNRAAAWEMLKGLDGYSEAAARAEGTTTPGPEIAVLVPVWCSDPEQYRKFRGDLFCK